MAQPTRVTLIGVGTIGLSFAALHLFHAEESRRIEVTIYDTRPDIEDYVRSTLPKYCLEQADRVSTCFSDGTLKISHDIASAVSRADIVQEQGPENLAFKASMWPEIEDYCSPECLLWSSTSGIPASGQSKNMRDPSRLLVVHPYNPPHIMPLLEVVPSPMTRPEIITRTVDFWRGLGREPVVIKKEVTGFVANRLAFALFREAIHLVNDGVASVEDIDKVVQASMGPRWTVAGPFKSYHAGGGQGGLEAFFKNIGGTVQHCWKDSGQVNVGDGWEEQVFQQTKEAYGVVNTGERDRRTIKVLNAVAQDSD
ncbi:MAG: hypothetical protein LQ347_005916 [Umbilicaria vellea]|nr:MAG: hypothetical protein LQ347_005916 [Umbilicaria vellea]